MSPVLIIILTLFGFILSIALLVVIIGKKHSRGNEINNDRTIENVLSEEHNKEAIYRVNPDTLSKFKATLTKDSNNE